MKKPTTLITLLLILSGFSLSAQPGGQFILQSGKFSVGYDIIGTQANTFVLTGRTISTSGNDYDILLAEVDTMGNLLGSRSFGGPDYEMGYQLIERSANSWYLTGRTESYGAGNADMFLAVVSLDAGHNFAIDWFKTYGGAGASFNFGGFEVPEDIEWASHNRLAMFGHGSSDFSTDGMGDPDMYLVITDTLGNQLQTVTTGEIPFGSDYGMDFVPTQDGGYALMGYGGISSGTFFTKLDSSGNRMFSKKWNVDLFFAQEGLHGAALLEHQDGGFYLLGYLDPQYPLGGDPTPARLILIRTDSAGNRLWDRAYKIPTHFNGPSFDVNRMNMIYMPDSSLLIGGTHLDDSLREYQQPFLANISQSGEVLWRKRYPASDRIYLENIRIVNGSMIAGVGYAENFQSGITTIHPMYFFTNLSGDLCRAMSLTTDTLNIDLTPANLPRDSVSSGGTQGDAVPASMAVAYTPGDACILMSAPHPGRQTGGLVLWPHPVSGQINVQLQEDVLKEISIFDLSGTRIYHQQMQQLPGESVSLNLPHLPAGIYLMRVDGQKSRQTEKFTIIR